MTSPEPKSNHSSAPAFEFITLTQRPASHKNDFSYTVRSHAMQFFLRQKKISKTSKEVQPVTMHPGAESKTPRELSGKFKLATWSRKSRRKVVKDRAIDTLVEIRDEFSSVKYSPEQKPVQHTQITSPLQAYGNALPIAAQNSSTQQLLYHYNTAFRANAFAINFDDAWKPFSITDSALLHATLCLTAQHQDLLRGTDDSKENLWHKGEAMSLMNRRLSEVGRLVNDADIISVALLVIVESINGTLEAAFAHRVGLNKMIDVHNGYLSFQHRPVVMRVLAWSEIVYSTRFGAALIFPCLFPSSDPFTGTLSHMISTHPSSLLPTSILSTSSSVSLLQTLRNITYGIDGPFLQLGDKKAIVDALYTTEISILTSEHRIIPFCMESSTEFVTTLSTLTQAFTISSLLYLQSTIRELPPSLLHYRLLDRLLSLLKSISWYNLLSSSDLDILLWCVFVGISCAKERDTRVELVVLMRDAEPTIEWLTVDEVRERLRRIVWREGICDEKLDVIWGRIMKRGSD